MENTTLADCLSENDLTLTYDPNCESKYAPDVFTISSGELFPDNLVKKNGDKLNSKGTTENNNVPWRGHNTNYWGSEGCFTGQTGNVKGDFTTVIKKLNDWGVTDKFDIPVSFGMGIY